jgi:GT2 family glycosyltransferase
MKSVPVAVLIPAWNGWSDTRLCLASLAACDPQPARVVVVDNASTDGTPRHILEEYPGVEVRLMERNLGFAGAVNRGLERITTDLAVVAVLLLNNDTVVEPDALGRLWLTLEADPRAAGVCPLIPYLEPADRVWYAGGKVALWRGLITHQGIRRPLEDIPPGVRSTGYLTGAAALLRAATLREIGPLDECFPFYAEDVDWSLRTRRAGWHLLFDPGPRIAHRVSASIGGPFSRRKLFAKARATLRLLRRHAAPWMWLTLLPAALLLTLPQTVAGLLRGIRR